MRYGLAVIAFIVVAFLGIIFFVNRSPSPSTTTNPSTSTIAKSTNLADYKNKDAVLSLKIQGRLVGEQERRAVRISISPSERRLEILTGYEEYVERSQSYPSTQAAYEAFLAAINTAGLTRSQKTTITDPNSICPIGQHYFYEVSESGVEVSRLWSVACTGYRGSFGGNGPVARQLFQAQIPDYTKQLVGVKIY